MLLDGCSSSVLELDREQTTSICSNCWLSSWRLSYFNSLWALFFSSAKMLSVLFLVHRGIPDRHVNSSRCHATTAADARWLQQFDTESNPSSVESHSTFPEHFQWETLWTASGETADDFLLLFTCIKFCNITSSYISINSPILRTNSVVPNVSDVGCYLLSICTANMRIQLTCSMHGTSADAYSLLSIFITSVGQLADKVSFGNWDESIRGLLICMVLAD